MLVQRFGDFMKVTKLVSIRVNILGPNSMTLISNSLPSPLYHGDFR